MRYALLAATAALGLTIPAHASPLNPVTVRVSYRDLNIASEQGVAKLKARVRSAIRRACESDWPVTLQAAEDEAACVRDATILADREIERHRQRNFAMLTQPAG